MSSLRATSEDSLTGSPTSPATQRPPAAYTLFTTPGVSPVLRWLSVAFLGLAGWRTVVQHPREGGYVFTAAPHTSNWDAVFMLAVAAKERIAVHWFAKASLFKGPLRPVMRWLGAIPVDRSQRNSLVNAAIAAFAAKPDLILGMSPEGTRRRIDHWKSGFYRIARGAGVPVVPGFLDYGRKIGGTGAPITLTGSVEADLGKLRSFYRHMSGRRSSHFDPESIRFRPRDI